MKTPRLIALTLLATLGSLQAQGGSLTPPPGAPAPVMRSLTEIYDKAAAIESQNSAQNTQLTDIQNQVGSVEKRIAVNSLSGDANSLHLISQPGSYYLTGNITGVANKYGIEITAANVTLDLNGFTLIGSASSLEGIYADSAASNVTIRNGKLTGWSQANMAAIRLVGVQSQVEDVHVASSYNGIVANGAGARISRCHAISLTGTGGIIAGTIGNPSTGSASLVADCVVRGITTSVAAVICGIQATTVTRSHLYDVECSAGQLYGIMAENTTGCQVKTLNASSTVTYIFSKHATDCYVEQSSLPAVAATETTGINGSMVSNCTIARLQTNSTGGAVGIKASRVTNCVVQSVTNTAGALNVIGITGNTVWAGVGGVEAAHISGCTVSSVTGIGIRTSGTCLIENNIVQYCTGASAYAIYAVASGIVRGNTTSNSTNGIYLSKGSATANVSISDTTAFSFGATCRYGPIVTGGGSGGFDATSNFDQ